LPEKRVISKKRLHWQEDYKVFTIDSDGFVPRHDKPTVMRLNNNSYKKQKQAAMSLRGRKQSVFE